MCATKKVILQIFTGNTHCLCCLLFCCGGIKNKAERLRKEKVSFCVPTNRIVLSSVIASPSAEEIARLSNVGLGTKNWCHIGPVFDTTS